ncbi:hypothetical protein PR202_gb19176 [Eleusine coracana subsp. coracana]|uniref:Calcineurin-like phosphoesterase domain-containing protein n=1 Tax=Eleusine coracana subsp. coracana TaxID=191504 RepID=A0AAV5F5B0_ELECO|nr:hypothetical protein PR202_gb19176 [Eleusine coracana subsp. coracana]
METAALALLAVTAALVMCAPAAARAGPGCARMGRVGDELNIEFVISTGDNFYEDGLTGVDDPAFEQSFTDIYTAKSLQKPWYLVLGNHDYRGDVLAQLSPVLREIDSRFICMRSFVDLDEAMKKSTAKWKIAVGHHTMRTVSHHGASTTVASNSQVQSNTSQVEVVQKHGEDTSSQMKISSSSSTMGKGSCPSQLDQDQADFTFYDVDGNILYQYSQCRSTKTYLLQHPSYLTDE